MTPATWGEVADGRRSRTSTFVAAFALHPGRPSSAEIVLPGEGFSSNVMNSGFSGSSTTGSKIAHDIIRKIVDGAVDNSGASSFRHPPYNRRGAGARHAAHADTAARRPATFSNHDALPELCVEWRSPPGCAATTSDGPPAGKRHDPS